MELLSYETDRIIIRPTALSDADLFLELFNTPKWLKYVGDRNVHSLEDAKSYIIERMLPQQERLGYGNYLLERKVDGAKMGSCGLYDREGMTAVDLGFALLPEFEGKGYAFEAASRIMQGAKQDFGLIHLQGYTTKDNVASQRLLKKLGFKQTSTVMLPGDEEELLLFEVLL